MKNMQVVNIEASLNREMTNTVTDPPYEEFK